MTVSSRFTLFALSSFGSKYDIAFSKFHRHQFNEAMRSALF